MEVKIHFSFLLFEVIRCTRLLQEKVQVQTALSETKKHAPNGTCQKKLFFDIERRAEEVNDIFRCIHI